jgi:hypothetical protein
MLKNVGRVYFKIRNPTSLFTIIIIQYKICKGHQSSSTCRPQQKVFLIVITRMRFKSKSSNIHTQLKLDCYQLVGIEFDCYCIY